MQYEYRTATGTVAVDIAPEWADILRKMDKHEQHKKIVAARHEVYAAKDADFFDSLPFEDPEAARVSGMGLSDEDERVQQTLSRMKPRQADLLRTIYFDGVSQVQLARREGVSKASISQRVQTAKENFRKIYQNVCERG